MPPTPAHVQIAPDGAGKDIDAQSLTSTEPGAPTVYRQVVNLGDPSAYSSLAGVNADGSLKVEENFFGSSVAVTRVGASTNTAGVSLLASNAARRSFSVFNDSTANLYLLLGAGTPSATHKTIKLAPASFYELPPAWHLTGPVSGLWDAVNGGADVTELT